MKTLRRILRTAAGRVLTTGLLAATIHVSIDPRNYLYALEVERQKEANIRAIAAKMNVDPEFLLHPQGRTRFDFRSLFNQVSARLGLQSEAAVENNAQPASVRESIQRVKDRYALVAADTTLARIAQLVQVSLSPDSVRGKKKGQIKAELQSVLRLIDKDFLPAVKDDAPGVARSRDAQMRREIKELQKRVKSVINAPRALDEDNLESTLVQLRNAVSGTLTVRNSKPRWTRDPFPVKDTYRFAPTTSAGSSYGDDAAGAAATTPSVVAQSAAVPAPASAAPRLAALSVAGEVTALANTLGTPAKIFSWVHDNIEWQSYSGVAKGSLGTLQERAGNDWDQALLLRDLLAARGYDARLEWGKVTLPIAKAMNLVGTEDPLQAGNLLATAGFDGLLLTAKNQPIAVQMSHVWVRAHIPYIPNRGATNGTPDTWVRMDPSFKRYEYQPGIAINGKVAWNEDEYLQSSAIRPPADFYGDKIWNYIRANDIDCVNLSQVAKAGRIRAANFPFVPATLTTRIDTVGGVNAAVPAEQMQSVTMNVTDINGAVLSSYTASLAELWGKKLSITFPPATADDAATIASYGGLFNTPAYLIKLKPVFSIDDQPVADGSPVPAGAVLDLNTTFRQPNVADDFTHHELVAGETHAIVLDPGSFPDSLIESRINRLKALTNEEAILSEKLFLVGLRYMQHVDDGINFAAGVRWQRPVKRTFEADVRRQIDITYNVAGAAVRLNAAENNIDVSRLLVGIVPINNDLSNRAQALALAGLQSSYLEGAIWEEMESQQGISAVKALLLARMGGQQIHTVNSSNVNTVLNAVNLSADVEAEIRGAVAQGRIAKIPSSELTLNRWSGAGYILQDPQTGAATYPISGGLAGGSTTGKETTVGDVLLGSEGWLDDSPIGDVTREILDMMGINPDRAAEAPSATKSDPVNVTSGNMHRTISDFRIVARGIPVLLKRTYNSRSSYNGPFGYGWTFNYGERVVTNPDGSVTYHEGDGTEHHFQRTGSTFVSPPGKHIVLTPSGAGYAMVFKDGSRHDFDGRGNISAISDLNGNSVTIQHDAAGLPATIKDPSGRITLSFTVEAGKITRITDVIGRTALFEYDGDDLVAFTDTAGKRFTMSYDLAHNMTSFADPLGNTQSYDYDTDDRMFHHVDAVGAEEFFQYDIAGRQTVVTNKRGGEGLVGYDELGRATFEADAAGNIVTATFNADNHRTAVMDSRGNVTSFEYDAQGNVTRQVMPDGGVIATTYGPHSRELTVTDELSGQTTNVWDAGGNLIESRRTVDGRTEITKTEYDQYGQTIAVTDPNGNVTRTTWNANGGMESRTDALNNTTTVQTDAIGRISVIRDPAGNETKFGYDGRDRMVSLTDAYNNSSAFAYDDAGRRTSITTARGTSRFTYDGEGRLLTFTDALGSTTRMVYAISGDLVSRTDAKDNTTKYQYDLVGRVTKMIDPAGGVWTYAYCASIGGSGGGSSCSACTTGAKPTDVCEIIDPDGNVLKQEFDNMGRIVAVTDSLANVMRLQYDKTGRITAETDANGNTKRYEYDLAGRLVAVTEADGSVTSYTYDPAGNKTSQTDANGATWKYKYDALNRLVEETDPLTRKTTYTYDAIGNLRTRTDAKNQTTTHTYVGRRLMLVEYSDGTSDAYTYDSLGRRTGASNANVSYTYTHDAADRVTSILNNRVGYKTVYQYDANGNRSKLITPQSTVEYVYDGKNRLTTMRDSLFGQFHFRYDAMDRRTELQYPNGIKTAYAYDDASRLLSMAARDSAGNVVDGWSYQYDAVGNVTSKTDHEGKVEIYRYDQLYRLTEANYSNGTAEKFTYDRVGNRTSRVAEAGTVTTYSYDVANQLLQAGAETLSYDFNGNVTSRTGPAGATTFTYDVLNRPLNIASPSGTETNKYGPNGERMEMAGASIEGGLVRPQYDPAGNPIADSDGNNGMWTYRLYGPSIDEPLAEWRRNNNRITYLHRDGLGSITAVSNTAGQMAYRQRYTAFGQMTRTTDPSGIPPTRLGFTSRETSVSTLIQYRARYYDTSLGRFIQQDSYRGNVGNPPSLHRYVYVYNNPIRYTDPSGHNPVAVAAGVLGAGIAIGAELLAALLLYLIIFLAIMAILYCWTDPVCKRFVKCFMQFIGRAFKCLLVALDVRTVDREACMINCIKAAWDRIKKCRSGFGNYYPMPWEEIKASCRTPPAEPGDDDDDDDGPGKEWWDQVDRAA
ncbi:MAG TPA: DUF6531 domain-containing protein [Thermoanaerobaculia bacterium]|jgi:RHS repeat-associated protein